MSVLKMHCKGGIKSSQGMGIEIAIGHPSVDVKKEV